MFKRAITISLYFTAIIFVLTFCKVFLYQSHLEDISVTAVEYVAELDAAFLSDEYFSELDGSFEKIKNENVQWYDREKAKIMAAGAVLNKMMDDLESNPEALKSNDNYIRFFETFDNYILMLDQITERMHYFRNTLNTYGDAPVKLDDMINLSAEGRWHLFSAEYHLYHYGGLNGALNVKFISNDGRFEAVYNTETWEILTDPANMGTYNYAPGALDLLKFISHTIYDKEPWKQWGNVEGFAYEDIMKLESGRGTDEAKKNKLKVKALIEKRKSEIE